MESARRSSADSAPGTVASRSPARMIAPGCLIASAARASTAARSSRTAVSEPGTAGIRVPRILASPGPANGATEKTFRPFLRAALRRRRKTIGDSSSGSKPARSTAGAFSRSA
ncbi:hypothetical protein GCM10018952_46170 [Streptosporangium vulgare]